MDWWAEASAAVVGRVVKLIVPNASLGGLWLRVIHTQLYVLNISNLVELARELVKQLQLEQHPIKHEGEP